MNTPQPSNQLPEEVKPPYKISEREPVFPCWLRNSKTQRWCFFEDKPSNGYIATADCWSPDQPTAPTARPEESASQQSPTPRTDAVTEHHYCGGVDLIKKVPADLARTLERELAQAKAEKLDALVEVECQTSATLLKMQETNADLRAQLAAARADKERLDWLEETNMWNRIDEFRRALAYTPGPNQLRAALDAARQEGSK